MGDENKNVIDKREASSYIMFGACTTLISWLSYAFFTWIGLEVNVSNILSWVCGVLFAFVVNKWFVFRCRSTDPRSVFKELGSFFSARIFTGVIAFIMFPTLLYLGLDGQLLGVDGFQARIVTSLIEITLNFIFSKYYIFIKKSEMSSR